LGANASLEPTWPDSEAIINSHLIDGADLSYELSGSVEALNQVIAWTGFSGRVLLGSWYGNQRANLDLGGAFHRSRIQLVSSQVSTIAPHLSGRWTKARRFDLVWKILGQVGPSKFITHKIPFSQADQAYQLLDQHPEETIQVVFTYS
jgi:threonine dehydrogenase-like Zn-dependent dehydrogenase